MKNRKQNELFDAFSEVEEKFSDEASSPSGAAAAKAAKKKKLTPLRTVAVILSVALTVGLVTSVIFGVLPDIAGKNPSGISPSEIGQGGNHGNTPSDMTTGSESAEQDSVTSAETEQTDAAAETRASEGLNLAVTKDNTGSSYIVLTGIGNCTDGVVVIPEEYEGLPVREIKKSAFDSCDSITEVIIPASVTKIGDFAFRNCPRLEKAVLGCVAEIGLSMFEDCVSLNTVVLPDGMVEIPSFMLKGCASLGSIHIPESVKIIRDEAFFGCSSLSDIKLPSGLKSICAGAFSGCTSLKVDDDFLPSGLVYIGSGILDYPGEIPPMRCAPWSKFWENEDGTRFGTYDYYVGKYLICLRTGENRYEIKEGTALLPECTYLSDYRLDFTLVIPESVTALSQGWQRIPNYKVEYKGSRQQWENIPRYNALGNRLPEIGSEDRSIVITFMK